MNKLQISGNGFPGTNKTWRFLQAALGDAIHGITSVLGDKVILNGVEVSGDQVANGAIIFNGEIFPFEGGLLGQDVTIMETIENVDYKIDVNNDNLFDNLPAYITKVAKCGTGGVATFPFADLVRLTRLQDVFNGDYNNLSNLPELFSGDYNDLENVPDAYSPEMASETVAGILKLATYWDIYNGTDEQKAITPKRLHDYIKIQRGNQWVGDIFSNKLVTINLYPALPTANYKVFGTIISHSSDWDDDNDVMFVVREKTVNSFKITIKEVVGNTQNLSFDYLILMP